MPGRPRPAILRVRSGFLEHRRTRAGHLRIPSGSPFLIDPGGPGGGVTVVGVIGGYQQGGDSADVSYAAAFGSNVQALYDVAVAQG
jgi:hypothetical protein